MGRFGVIDLELNRQIVTVYFQSFSRKGADSGALGGNLR